jgi:hypothetical protein
MSSTLQRKKRLNIKILESGLDDGNDSNVNTNKDVRCRNCKEWQYLVEQQTDRNNLFCTHCGSLTPLRTIKHSRGLAAPAIQQSTRNLSSSILQSKSEVTTGGARSRRPHGIHDKPRASAAQHIINTLTKQGFEIVDSQYTEPTPTESNY